jgi:hypothetical protein
MTNSRKLQSLALALLLLLPACAQATSSCPPYPIAGASVADELEKHCAECDATWEWLSRIAVLKEQLAKCNK